MSRVPAPHRRRSALIAALTVLFALVTPAAITQADPHPQLTVMTRNLYLGSSLAPATDIDPSDPNAAAQFVGAVATIYGTSVFTDFPTRSAAIADEVAADEPDLIGLQEVSNWTVIKAGNQAATAPSFDFLSILLTAL
ncbi:MAG TPA: hypothetical protein VF143_12730, partial [Candidatus Nanopelagicales bacterium]